MKKIVSILAIVIFSAYSCSKEGDPIYIIREHLYKVTNMLVPTGGGNTLDLRWTMLGFAETVTFKMSGLGSGTGVVTVTSTTYTETQLAFYGWSYDYVYQCWYYEYSGYRVTLAQVSNKTYGFKWHRSGSQANIDFADFADVAQGTNLNNLWKTLEGKYHPYPDEFFPNSPIAKRIALKGNPVTMVIEY